MHQILRGALGAAMVYPLVWYYYSQSDPVQPAAISQRVPSTERQASRASSPELPEVEPAPQPLDSPSVPPNQQAAALEQAGEGASPEQSDARRLTQRVALPAAPLDLPSEPQLPQSPDVPEPKVPFPAFAELREAFGQVKDIQGVSHDPKALDERLQSMQHDPQKLARLKAFAEQLVHLPPPPGERYLPAGSTARPASSR